MQVCQHHTSYREKERKDGIERERKRVIDGGRERGRQRGTEGEVYRIGLCANLSLIAKLRD